MLHTTSNKSVDVNQNDSLEDKGRMQFVILKAEITYYMSEQKININVCNGD
jgi:hypothetical protein